MIDPKTGSAERVPKAGYGTERPQPIAVNSDGVWVCASDGGCVVHVDPGSAVATKDIEVPAPCAICAA